ncbi:hypothetical protein ACJX0J_014010, partial [Zea mays]
TRGFGAWIFHRESIRVDSYLPKKSLQHHISWHFYSMLPLQFLLLAALHTPTRYMIFLASLVARVRTGVVRTDGWNGTVDFCACRKNKKIPVQPSLCMLFFLSVVHLLHLPAQEDTQLD